MTAQCEVCFRQCRLEEGQTGFCGARENQGGMIIPKSYGQLTAIALDPIEKKPLARFFPGSMILSVGSYGCSMACPFCQNHEIARPADVPPTQYVIPEELAKAAVRLKRQGNIGVAYTYNEMTTAYEYIRDTAKLVRAQSMKNVLVTNGNVRAEVLKTFLPYIDAMNIDLKGFSDRYYRDVLGGSREMTMRFIEKAARACHVELTCLIVPGENDSEDEIDEMSRWIASLETEREDDGISIPLHISRFFPRFHMTDRGPTPVATVYRLADKAREHLRYVYTGNC